MRFTLSWLKDHLETDADLETLLDRLTMVGLEVEKVTNRAQGLETFIVGHVVEALKHPNADKLKVCKDVHPKLLWHEDKKYFWPLNK